jgi:hypothetical protein
MLPDIVRYQPRRMFVEVAAPFRARSAVRITTSNDEMTFKVFSNVVVAVDNFGMGLAFETFGALGQFVRTIWQRYRFAH